MGRKPIGDRAMTPAEKMRRYRARHRPSTTMRRARAVLAALPKEQRFELACFVVCQLSPRQLAAFQDWHNRILVRD